MNEQQILPVVPLRGGVVFPGTTTTIFIGRRLSLEAARSALKLDGHILITVQYDSETETPDSDDLTPIAILGNVHDVLRAPQGIQMVVELERRVHFNGLSEREPFLRGSYSEISDVHDPDDPDHLTEAIAYLERYGEQLGELNPKVLANLRERKTPGDLADYVANLLPLGLETEISLLLELNGVVRLEFLREYLEREARIVEIRTKIEQDAQDGAEKAQREYLLREQMKAIRRELGEDGDSAKESLRTKIEDAGMPEKVEEKALSELDRLEQLSPQAPETGVIRTYLEWLIALPWQIKTEDDLDVANVRAVLDADHYGLDEVKDRIVEFVAVRKLAGNKMKGAIINLNGPPGVGKTSIATSVARAIGRESMRISLGGVRDEAEIRGHRRTYIGALPGRIIRTLRDAGTRNPVIILDEIDKVGADWRGDPSSALLEVLDPEQNGSFTDHYLEVPFDLSDVIFITTSNTTATIPAALLDRMESINMPGYIEDEKQAIAENYLLAKQLKAHGVADIDIRLESDALQKLIRRYTYEAGVRQLERTIGALVRKLAVRIAGGEAGPFVITEADVVDFLGPEKFNYGRAEEKDEVGVVTGLAVSSFGGDILAIEVSLSEGQGRITLTGSLGDVMQESARAALTYARANARHLDLKPSVFDLTDIHVHVPAGAQPKDGPSAGISMATAIISAFTNRPVRRDVAMTGEVTLRGKVLPIGGLKAKTIAAHRAGITTVILPKDNAKDIPDLPQRIRDDLTLIPVSHLDEVLAEALLPPLPKATGPEAGILPPDGTAANSSLPAQA